MKKLLVLIALFTQLQAKADIAFLAVPMTRNAAGVSNNWKTQSVSFDDGPLLGFQRVDSKAVQILAADGSGVERELVKSGGVDFVVSIDGNYIFATVCQYDTAGKFVSADIEKYEIATGRKVAKLTNGGLNQQPVELGNGDICWLTAADGWKSPKANYPAFTIWRMDAQGNNKRRIDHMDLGGVYGLFAGPDGRLYYTTGQNQGLHVPGGFRWALWSINPDGSDFQPEESGFGRNPDFTPPADWPVILPDGTMVWAIYYNTRVMGRIAAAPLVKDEPHQSEGKFTNPEWEYTVPQPNGQNQDGTGPIVSQYGFLRKGQYSPAPWATDADYPNKKAGELPGMLSHPYPVPGGHIYCTWSGDKGDANIDLGVYMIPAVDVVVDGVTVKRLSAPSHKHLIKVVDKPGRHEWMGKRICSWKELYGQDRPPVGSALIDESLPPGSPYGTIGTSSLSINEILHEVAAANPGPSLVKINEDDVEFVRIVGMAPTRNMQQGAASPYTLAMNGPPNYSKTANYEGFWSEVNERLGLYEVVIPVKKYRTTDGKLHIGLNPPAGAVRIKRADGTWDTSFKCQIPANQAWSLQLLDKNQKILGGMYQTTQDGQPNPKFAYDDGASMAQTWHQVVSREKRTNCQGCHAHWKPDKTPFEQTIAASKEYPVFRLKKMKTVVFERDVQPLNLGITQRPWEIAQGQTYHASYDTTLWKGKGWPAAAEQVVADWQATGFMAAGKKNSATIPPSAIDGPYLWTAQPTLTLSDDWKFFGALQAANGIQSVEAIADGKNITNRLTFNAAEDVYALPSDVSPQRLKIAVVDMHGMKSELDFVRSITPPPDPPDPDPQPPQGQYIGIDADMVGEKRNANPDGKLDYHIHVKFLRKEPLFVNIRAGGPTDSVTWGDRAVEEDQTPDGTGTSWIIKMVPRFGKEMDIWFAPRPGITPTEFRFYANYSEDGTDRDFIRIPVPVTPPPTGDCAEELADLQAELLETQQALDVAIKQRDEAAKAAAENAQEVFNLNGQIAQLKLTVQGLNSQVITSINGAMAALQNALTNANKTQDEVTK